MKVFSHNFFPMTLLIPFSSSSAFLGQERKYAKEFLFF